MIVCLSKEAIPAGERIDKPVKISIRQRPIHITVELGQVACYLVRRDGQARES
jgi:hypothetical protein